MYRKGSYIAARIAGLLAVMILACLVAVQTPYVQTEITRKVLDRLTEKLEGTIEYDELRVMPSGVLLLKNAVIADKAPYSEDINGRGWEPVDTLFKARTITATFSLASLFSGGGIHISRVNVSDAMLHLAVEPDSRTNLERMFNLTSDDEPAEPGPEIFSIRKVSIRNFRFRLNNFEEKLSDYPGYGFNYDDLDLTADINGHGLRFAGGRMYGVADKVTLTEKSGYRLLRASGRCVAGQGKTEIENFRLTDPWSKINVKNFSMTYSHPKAFKNFTEEVLLECELRKSEVGIPTLKYLAGLADNVNSTLEVSSCMFKGYVNDFRVDDFVFRDIESGVAGKVSGNAIGLPDTGRMMAGIKIEGLKFTTRSLSGLLAEWLPGADLPDLTEYARGIHFTLDATAEGPLDRLKASALLHSAAGGLRINADVRNLISRSRGLEISGTLNTYGLQINSLYPELPFGDCTLEARAAARIDNGMSRVRLDTLGIRSINYNGIDYAGISASGSYIDNTMVCKVKSTDPTLELSFDAAASFGQDGAPSNYKLTGKAANIDLHKLGIDKREGISRTGFGVDADISTAGTAIEGHASLDNIEVENRNGRTNVGNVEFRAYMQNGEQCFGLDSPFAAVSFSGTGSVEGFIEAIQDITLRRHLSAIYPAGEEIHEEQYSKYRLEAQFHDSRELMSFVMPGLYISDSTRLALSVSADGNMDVSLRSPRLAFGREYVKNVDLQFDSDTTGMEANFYGTELRTGNILVSAPSLTATAAGNSFDLALNFDSFAGGGKDGQLLVEGSIARDSTGLLSITAHPQDSYIATAEGMWIFNESQIHYNGSELTVNGFSISKDNQKINIDGGYSTQKADTLSLVADNIDLSLIDEFLPEALGIRGTAAGRMLLTSGTSPIPGLLMNFRLDSLGIGGTDAGSIRIASALGEQREDISIILRHRIAGKNALAADGRYRLDDGSFKMTARLDSLPASVAGPFLTGVFDEVGGSLSGEVSLARDSSGFSVSGNGLHVDGLMLGVAYTGVNYTISGPLRLDNSGLYFDNLLVSDGAGGSGNITGAVRHKRLSNFELDAQTTLDDLRVVDAREGGSSGIYGRLSVSGNASASGPFSSLGIKAAIRTSGTGNIHIPASESISSSTSNLLTFTQPQKPVDPYDEMLSNFDTGRKAGGDIDIQARITAHPGVTAFIELDKSEGSIASFSGEGSVNLHLRPASALFDINGDYIISEGNYTFSIPGILNRDFRIEDGSSVRFSGRIPDTELNLDAVYSLKTSLSSLIADGSDSESSAGSTREVLCGINIAGSVRDPRLSFSIDVPDLNPTVKSQVETALNTDDKVQKQFLALLLLGSFIPDEQSGVVNGSNILLSNVTELMSNQLNSILQKLDIPVDVGIGYQSASSGTNIFDVAISTQLFNNRVLVGGNVGSRRYGSSTATNGDVVGDLDIQIKLDPEGKFRLNLFSHSADEYSNYLDYSQRNGVGISYQKEYARFNDLWRSIFSPNKAKESQKPDSTAAPAANMSVIRIENEQGKTLPDTDTTGRK